MKPAKASFPTLKKKQIQLIASGDLRLSANQVCWPAQKEMEATLTEALAAEGYELVRAHTYDAEAKHGFIDSQRKGMEVFKNIDPQAPLIPLVDTASKARRTINDCAQRDMFAKLIEFLAT